MKYLLLLFSLLFTFQILNAQKGENTTAINGGLGAPLLDNGLGVYLGVNHCWFFSSRIALEGQVSYLHTKITGSFLSGDTGITHSVNTLIGGRLYLSPSEKKVRPYLNLLVGGVYSRAQQESRDAVTSEFNAGISVGTFFEINHFLAGLSLESPSSLILKAGYIF
jgi:hypothetical protein